MKPILTASTCRDIAEGIHERTEDELRSHIERRLREHDKPAPDDLLDFESNNVTTNQVLDYFNDPRVTEKLLKLYDGLIDTVIEEGIDAEDYYRDVRAVGL